MEALENLVSLRRPIAAARHDLAQFPWDSEIDLVILTREHLRFALEQYQAGRLDDDDLSEWAEALVGREDVALDPADANLLSETLFALSTPEINQPVAVVARQTLDRI